MQVNELQARQGNVEITLEVIEKGEVRTFNKFGKEGRVCNVKAKDATGTISVTLWNDDIDKVNVGDTIKFENGWVGEWQGELQLSAGKFGKMEVTKGEGPAAEEKPAQEGAPVKEEPSAATEEPITEEEKIE